MFLLAHPPPRANDLETQRRTLNSGALSFKKRTLYYRVLIPRHTCLQHINRMSH
jgi:hypothetical protein